MAIERRDKACLVSTNKKRQCKIKNGEFIFRAFLRKSLICISQASLTDIQLGFFSNDPKVPSLSNEFELYHV